MRLLVSLVLMAEGLAASAGYRVEAGNPAPWREIFGVFSLEEGGANAAIVVGEGTALGFRPTARKVTVRSARDVIRPGLEIIWERAEEIPVYEAPASAQVFTRERWTGTPLVAGYRRGETLFLWTAVSPGPHGYERFPYLMQALTELGFRPPYRGNRLWAFFDSGYRARADFDYLAARWRQAGIAGLHVAAWHYFDGDAAKAAELERLIEACHRQRILVYAWLELPHVSERFWAEHPEWREKTALGEDAWLDWRKLMNLRHPECARAVADGVRAMMARFDWDGVNLAELYFESLEGTANAARFTPMNTLVREEFRRAKGWDPLEIFQRGRPPREFLDWRAELAGRLQDEWLGVLRGIKQRKPHLELVWTHIDDRYDPRMRDLLGADTKRAIGVLEQNEATFLIEDPATAWSAGPRRYLEIAQKYGTNPRLAIDINIVERYQDVYPTKQQTGVELFQLVHYAGQGFRRVAVYFENSILTPDYPLLSAATAPPVRSGRAERPYGVRFVGPAQVN